MRTTVKILCLTFLVLLPAFVAGAQKDDSQRYPETATRRLTKEDVKGWSEAKLLYAINEIYARHGVDFPDKEIKKWFLHFSWYQPEEDLGYDEAPLTDIESGNVTLLRDTGASLTAHYDDEDVPVKPIAVTGAAAKTRAVSVAVADITPNEELAKDYQPGNIQVRFADGHTAFWTKGGHCLLPHVSSQGDVGWVYGGRVGPPPGSRRIGRDVLVVRLADGSERRFQPSEFSPFIEKWHFVGHASTVVIKTRENHGPFALVAYDLKTGRLLGHSGGNVPWEQMPEWARFLGDDIND